MNMLIKKDAAQEWECDRAAVGGIYRIPPDPKNADPFKPDNPKDGRVRVLQIRSNEAGVAFVQYERLDRSGAAVEWLGADSCKESTFIRLYHLVELPAPREGSPIREGTYR